MFLLRRQEAHRPEEEIASRRDDVIDKSRARLSQMNVLYGRIGDVLSVRADTVKEVSEFPIL